MSKSYVNNGLRIGVELADFVGLAGFLQRTDDTAELAYAPNRRAAAPPAPGDVLELNERLWRITARERSDYVEGMAVLSLTAQPAATAVQGTQV